MSIEPKAVLQCCLSSAWGGLEMVAFETAERLRATGHKVTTACAPDAPLHRELMKAGLPALPVRRGHKYFALGAVRTLRAELARDTYGAVLVHQLNDLWQLVPALRGFSDTRLVGVAHTFVGLKKKDFLHARLYRRLNTLIALTRLHKANLLEHLPLREEQITVLPNSVDTRKFHPSRRSAEFRSRYPADFLIGVVSRLDENKGLMECLAAAALLRDWGMNFQMVLVGKETAGESGMKETLESEIASLALTDRVHLAGHFADVAAVIAAFDVLLMPSRAETFGRVLIEAMACGVPVVACAGGGVPDIVSDEVNGLLVPPDDVEAMARALRRLHDTPSLRNRLAERGLIDAREIYDSRVIQKRLVHILVGS